MKIKTISVIAFTCWFSSSNILHSQDRKPNLLFIMADQWRGNALGQYGSEPVQVPHLEELASDGIIFKNAISNYPVSSPARAILMTGQYPTKNRVTSNCNSENTPYDVEMEEDAICWSDILAQQGYSTAYIGKWHLDAPYEPYVNTSNNKGKVAWNEWCPPERRHGFAHWIAYGTYDNHLKPMYWKTTDNRDDFSYVNQWGPEFEADQAINFINNTGLALRNPENPFAMMVSMNPPHTGYNLVPDKYKKIYASINTDSLVLPPNLPENQKTFYKSSILDYYACMTGVDEQIGRIIDALKQSGQYENTIIVFTSDHGDAMGMHNTIGKNTCYEESMHIPLIISWPKKLRARVENQLMISVSDMYPTLLTLMGFEEKIPDQVETFNHAKSILNPKLQKEIVQPYYLVNVKNNAEGKRGLRSNRYTFCINAENGVITGIELYDRKIDPFQMTNIANSNNTLVKKYKADLKKWLIKTNDPFASNL